MLVQHNPLELNWLHMWYSNIADGSLRWFIILEMSSIKVADGEVWSNHDDVITWKHFPRYWPFVRGIHRSPMNSPHKGQWRGTLMFLLICALNKRLSKQSLSWRFKTPPCLLWRQCNEKDRFANRWPYRSVIFDHKWCSWVARLNRKKNKNIPFIKNCQQQKTQRLPLFVSAISHEMYSSLR